ncbi:MAG: DNA-formamidopyrimidine glycosylase family protein [Streptosporangiaceae bacterium]
MPEGDTVWRVAARMHEALAGRTLTRFDLRVPRLATRDLTGHEVTEVVARGKHLLIRIDDLTLHSHLRMDGAWRLFPTAGRWQGGPTHQIRAIVANREQTAVGSRMHDLALLRTRDEARLVGHLGPDLLGDDWDAAEAVLRLAAAPTRPIAEALLDQRNLAGIGNVFKSEILFCDRVHPWTPAGDVDLPAVVATAHRLLTANRTGGRRRTTGLPGADLWVYGRQGRSCLRCGGRISSAEQDDRVTYWCPDCQRALT